MDLQNIFNQLKPLALERSLQEKSLSSFLQQGFPTRHEENWKYTDLKFLNTHHFEHAPFPEKLPIISHCHLKNSPSHLIVFIDGYFSEQLSQLSELPKSIKIIPLEKALEDFPEIIIPSLQENKSRLQDFNTALMQTGVFIHIPTHTSVDRPIHCLFIHTRSTLAVFKNVIILEPNSSTVLLEEHLGCSHFELVSQSVTHVSLKADATLEHYKLQREGLQSIHLSATEVTQSAHSTLKHYSISQGSKLARDDLHVSLNEPHATCELIGFYKPVKTQHIDHHTRIDHHAALCNSFEYYKGVLNDHAKGVFNGKVIVHPQAQKTRSRQVNKNLLLATTAEMNTKPELEIYADDVECTHGATVGQIDQEALFYMQSRGIDQGEAFRLLTQAFCDEVLDRIENSAISEHIREALNERAK